MDQPPSPQPQQIPTEIWEPPPTPVDAAAKEKYCKLFQIGLRWLCAGGVLMGLSFAVNFMFLNSESGFITAMYILTSLGAICILKGLADMVGF